MMSKLANSENIMTEKEILVIAFCSDLKNNISV